MTELNPYRAPERSQDVDSNVEQMAADARQEHERPILPCSAAEALRMTTTSTDDSALERVAALVLRSEEALSRIDHIEQRIIVYCGSPEAPTIYMQSLLRAAAGETLAPDERDHLRRVQSYVVSELAPQLHALQNVITDTALHHPELAMGDAWRAIAQPGGVAAALRTGRRGEQRMLSVFGLMMQAHAHDSSFLDLPAESPELPTQTDMEWVARIDPLDPHTQSQYWRERVRGRSEGQHWTLSQEIFRRSEVLVYELESAARQLPYIADIEAKIERGEELAEGEGQVLREQQAYLFLSQWVQDRAEDFAEPMSDAQVDRARSSLHFAHSSADQVLAVLNAAELVKERNPLLFLRMMGVAPGSDYGQRSAVRSDLFGSVFHLALHRSFNLRLPLAREGLRVFHNRVAQLFQMDAALPELLSISAEQMHQLEERYRATASRVAAPSEALMLTASFLTTAMPGHLLRRDLEQVIATVSLEERDHTLQSIVTGTPRQVIMTYQQLSAVQKEDPDILLALRQRLGEESVPGDDAHKIPFDSLVAQLILTSLSGHPRAERLAMRQMPLIFKLWETAPDEVLTTYEFFRDVEAMACADTVWTRTDMWNAIRAHPGITHDQWVNSSASYAATQQREIEEAGFFAKRALRAEYQEGRRLFIKDAWRALFKQLSWEEVRSFDSKVFAVVPDVEKLQDPKGSSTTPLDLFNEVAIVYQRGGERGAAVRIDDRESLRLLQRAFKPEAFVQRYGRSFIELNYLDMQEYLGAMPREEAQALLAALCDPDTRKTGLPWITDEKIYREQPEQGIVYHDVQHVTYAHMSTALLQCKTVEEAGAYLNRLASLFMGCWQATLLEFAHEYDVPIGDASQRGPLQLWSIIAFKEEYMGAARLAAWAQRTYDFPYHRLRTVMGDPGVIDREFWRLSPEHVHRVQQEMRVSLEVYRQIHQEYVYRYDPKRGHVWTNEERRPGHIYLQPGIPITDERIREWYKHKHMRMQELVKTLPPHMTVEREAAQEQLDFLSRCLA